ncbi:CBS domain-containing protein [Candidatus Parcubacteria bacterium]|nr:MAG: CBS domain-containing protein [Candidatus Parcubacteria bacterium]
MKNLAISPDATIRQAMEILDKSKEKCLAVTDERGKLLGTLAYADLRRSILAGLVFNSSIERSYNRNPTVLVQGRFTDSEAREKLKNPKNKMIPIIDYSGRYLSYLSWDQESKTDGEEGNETLNASVVIMAGGRGTRLEPFTKVLPKPLIPVNGKAIIEHIIERFTAYGVNDFKITVNYKSRILKAYFEDIKPGYSVHFIEEEEPLGTCGSLKFLKGVIDKPFIVTNCDILIDTDYIDFYKFHLNYGYGISLVASLKEYVIPYGTCELNGDGHLNRINEKPEYHFLVNTGMYILNPAVLDLIPDKKLYHLTDLIGDSKRKGLKVGVYPISESAWIDIGQWNEYHKAVEKFL